jgi:NTP pyrophosphatase (non-canonical NTP hydrolase)
MSGHLATVARRRKGRLAKAQESAMSLVLETTDAARFVERRSGDSASAHNRERRQFADSHAELSGEAQELADAIDQYKLVHRRRFITYEEMLSVMKSLGYHR